MQQVGKKVKRGEGIVFFDDKKAPGRRIVREADDVGIKNSPVVVIFDLQLPLGSIQFAYV